MSEQLRSSVVRIHDRHGNVVGAGFLVTEREILTCAHVVTQALGIPENTPEQPVKEIRLDFPLVAREKMLTARVILWRPIGTLPKEEEDIAVLKLEQETPIGAQAVRLVKSDELWGHVFRAFGFPVGYNHGVWASGRLLEREATGWVQIEDVKETGFYVQPGFSGGPVWDEQLNGVAGMIVAAEQRPEIKAAFIIPADVLVKTWPALEERTIPPCPYRGLFAFREQDAPFFFGREAFTKQLVEAAQKKSLIAVIGSSGSGKSSVVFAGLLPHLRQFPFQASPPLVGGVGGGGTHPLLTSKTLQKGQGWAGSPPGRSQGWVILHFRPSNDPFRALAAALIPLLEPEMSETKRLIEIRELTEALHQEKLKLQEVVERILQKNQSTNRLLLFADQFEELYTLCPDSKIRQQFLDELLSIHPHLPISPSPHLPIYLVVLTLRADFMEQALTYRPFADALQDNTLNLGPMTREELQRAIQCPAEKLNITFETGLVESILDDIEDEPGNLPLLEFALTLLWDRQTTDKLTHEAYEAIGQVKGVLTRHADEVYADLNEDEQQQLRRVLVQLVRPGKGTEDTRRLASRKELNEDQWALVRRIADARLVVTDRDPAGEETVEVVHESLIRGWGKLREWMQADRGFRTWQERLRAALHQWEASERDDGALLRGVPLAEAEEWLTEREADLSQTERQFIRKSLALQEQEQAEKEAQHRRELEAARILAEEAKARQEAEEKVRQEAEQRVQEQTRATKRLRWLVVGLALVFLIAVGIALFAIQERNKAQHAEHIAEQERDKAKNAETEAKWQAIIAQQQEEEAKKQALEAERQTRIAQARRLAAQAQVILEQFPQRSLLLAVEALNVTLREGESRIPVAEQVLRDALAKTGGIGLGLGGDVIAVSPDSHWLVTGSGDATVRLWDLTAEDPAASPLVLRGHKDDITTVAFSPDIHWLVTGSADQTARLWDLSAPNPTASSIVLRGHEEWIETVSFSPDGHWLVTGSGDTTARLWDLTASNPAAPLVLYDHKSSITAMAISPDSHWLVTASENGTARLWNLMVDDPSPTPVILPGYVEGILSVPMEISPNSDWLVTGSWKETTVRLWNLTAHDPTIPVVLDGHKGGISTVVISPDNHWLVTGSYDATAQLWDLTAIDPATAPVILSGHEREISSVAISSDSHWLVTGSEDGTARLWNLTAPDPTIPIILDGHKEGISTVAFSPDNYWLVTGSRDGTARLWNLTIPDPAATPIVLRGHDWTVSNVTISADSRWLVTGSKDGTTRLWNLTAPDSTVMPIVLHGHEERIQDVAFSPDTHWLVTSSYDKTARLWNLTTSDPTATPIVLGGHERGISTVTIGPNSHWLVTGSEDATARLWDLTATDPATDPIILSGHEREISNVAISPDSQWLVTASFDGTARLWNLTDVDPTTVPIVLRGHEGGINAMAISVDGRWLVTGGWDATARLWDLTTPDSTALPIVLQGHKGRISTVTFSPDNHWLVTGASGDATARLWDLTVPDPAATPIILGDHKGGISTVTISADGHWLVTGGSWDATARLWDLTAPDPAATPVNLRGHKSGFLTVTISPDSHWLVTASVDRITGMIRSDSNDTIIRLWDLTAPDPAATPIVLRGHEQGISAVAISADSHWLVTGSRDGTVRLWTLRLDKLLDLACRTVSRNLSYIEWDQHFRGEEYSITCSDLPIHPSVIPAAQDLARDGNIDGAIAIFQRALELDPRLDLDPIAETHKWALIAKGERLAQQGKFKEAIAAYEEAQKLDPTLKISAWSWNILCWDGSLWGYAAEVMKACEKAVEFAPGNGNIRDSRGLARALTGNIDGAVEDFQAFVDWTSYEEKKSQRQRWIEALRTGENPFTPEELEKLRRRE
jgi:WD40 repeat protein